MSAKPDCCQDDDNLEPESGSVSPDTVMVQLVCQECGRSHYVAAAKAKRYGLASSDA